MNLTPVIIRLLSALMLFGGNFAFASMPVPPDAIVEKCKDTSPAVEAKAVPPALLGKTNNLRRKTGSLLVAKGTPIVIYGKLLNMKCIPISDALIEVWQASGSTSKSKSFSKGDPDFVGSATTSSNNLGQFTLLSVIPPRFQGNKLLHIRIRHEGVTMLQTVIYVGDQAGNIKNNSERRMLTAYPDKSGATSKEFGTPYFITLVLKDKEDYRKF